MSTELKICKRCNSEKITTSFYLKTDNRLSTICKDCQTLIRRNYKEYFAPTYLDGEIWKDVPNYENVYQVSNLGRVKSCSKYINNHFGTKSFKKEIILKPKRCVLGYNYYRLCKDSIQKTYKEHRLVALAFIPNLENKPCVNHINGIKHDNRVENLEWVTHSENTKHAFNTNLMHNKKGFESPFSKLRKEDVEEIKSLKGKITQVAIAKKFNITPSTISKIINNKVYN